MPETNGRVTNSQLQAELKIVRLEQKNEHTKTRLLVIGVGIMSGATKLLAVAGVITVPHIHF